jgi:hypothetical protein
MEAIIERDLLGVLEKHLNDNEIIAIRGARQTGKSTLLGLISEKLLEKGIPQKQIIYITFEDPHLLDDFSNDPKGFLASYINGDLKHYFLIDEIQYDKQAGKHMKLVFDTISNIKIIMTGSSSLEISQISKFLVGRVYLYELYGLSFGEYLKYRDERLFKIYGNNSKISQSLMEAGRQPPKFDRTALDEINKELNTYLVYGSYPEVAKHENNNDKAEVIKNIYITYIGKDVTSLLGITDSSAFRKVLSLLSLQIGSLLNYNELAKESQTYYKQVLGYIAALEETYIAKLLRPFHKNLGTELRKNPKIYMLDTGLRNYISNSFNGLDNRDDAGHLVENFVFNQLYRNLQPNQQLNFWRTLGKAEVDFVFSNGSLIVPIEVKFSNMRKPEINRGMNSFIERYKPKYAIVATKDFEGKMSVDKTDIYFIPVAFIGTVA